MRLDFNALLEQFKAARRAGLRLPIAYIGKTDGTIDASADTGESYTVWARAEGDSEPLVLYYTPGLVPLAWLATDVPVTYERNTRGQLEIKGLAPELRDALGGAFLPTNAYDWIHTHESDAEAGQLNASLIFDAGTVPVVYGGTNISSYAVGDLIYASATGVLSRLADVATGNALISGGVGVAPSYGKIGLTTHVSGTLPIANGGTNLTTYATGDLIYASAANALSKLAAGTDGFILTLAAGVPTWAANSPATGGGWTDDGAVVRLTTSTDNVSIGSASNLAKLYILGTASETALRVRAGSGQPAFRVEDNSGNVLLGVNGSGQTTVNPSETTGGDFIVNGTSGVTPFFIDASANTVFIDAALVFNQGGINIDARFAGDNDANLIFADASTDRVGIGTSAPPGRLSIFGRADEVQAVIRGNGTQTSNILEIQTSAAAVVTSITNTGAITANSLTFNALADDTTISRLYIDANRRLAYNMPSASAADYMKTSAALVFAVIGADTTITTTSGPPGTTVAWQGETSIDANLWTQYRTMRIKILGYADPNAASDRISFNFRLNTTDLFTVQTQAFTTGSVQPFWFEAYVTCRTTGSSGTLFFQGAFIGAENTSLIGLAGEITATQNFNSTIANAIVVSAFWNNASNSLTVTNGSLEWLN